jgi:hypothetical protein
MALFPCFTSLVHKCIRSGPQLKSIRYAQLGAAFCSCLLIIPDSSEAQVAISVGVEEVYDSNVFLEDDNGQGLTLPAEPTPEQQALIDELPQELIDGKADDDIITNPFISISTGRQFGHYAKGGANIKFGALLFNEFTEQNRLSLDSLIKVESDREFIPDPFFVEVSSAVISGPSSVAVAEGSAARQSQTHDGNFSLGARDIDLAADTGVDIIYRFTRHDFLGDFRVDENSNAAVDGIPSETDILEDTGSDYYRNGVDLSLNHQYSGELELRAFAGAEYLDIISIDRGELSTSTISESELDRIDSNDGVGFTYRASQAVTINGQAGVDLSFYQDDREPRLIRVINPDGSTSEFITERDSEEVSFSFDLGGSYVPTEGTSINARALQSSNTDIDGERIITRSYYINASHTFTDRISASAGTTYIQFDHGDSLSDSSDRIGGTASLRLILTEALALTFGYNYVKQDGSQGTTPDVFANDDYDSHRAFISISGGLVAIPAS